MDGAVRGVREELGVTNVSLKQVSDVVPTMLDITELGVKDYEFQVTFRGVSDAKLKLSAAEVAEIRFYQVDDLKMAMSECPEYFTPWFRSCASKIGL